MFRKELNKKMNIAIDFGVKQYSAKGRELCGNAYNSFCDDNGNFVVILSDGLGTDEHAAVNCKMAVDLMSQHAKAGFEYNSALETITSSLRSNSFGESLATLDVATIDLCTGSTTFRKAGAAPSILRQNNSIQRIESSSLPAGLLHNMSFGATLVKCEVGDIVVMMSDGAINEDCDWIKDEIISFHDGKAQELAERLCTCACQRKSKNWDYITILCAILNEAVSF